MTPSRAVPLWLWILGALAPTVFGPLLVLLTQSASVVLVPVAVLGYLSVIGSLYVKRAAKPLFGAFAFVVIALILNVLTFGAGCACIISQLDFHDAR